MPQRGGIAQTKGGPKVADPPAHCQDVPLDPAGRGKFLRREPTPQEPRNDLADLRGGPGRHRLPGAPGGAKSGLRAKVPHRLPESEL
jgi:hypothetical protein